MKLKLTFLLLLFCAYGFAQRVIYGEVTNEEQAPLPGATVIDKNNPSVGSITDFDGRFTIEIEGETTLVISYIGYTSIEVETNGQDDLSVVLAPDNELDEVVVTSLGIARVKKALGYAVSEVEQTLLENRAEGDVGRILAGKASGVQITNQSGISGSGTSIIIRGFNTFSQGNQPLFIVDGVPFASDTNSQGNFVDGNNGSSRFVDIDPNNIADVKVLKGLAAANLYGTQGRNGVVIITTKSGAAASGDEKAKNEVNIASSLFFNEIASMPDYQNQYGNGFDQSFGWFFSNWGPSFDQDGVAGWAGQRSINGTLSGQAGFLRHPYTTASGATGIPQILPQLGIAEDATYEWRPYNSVEDFFRTGVISSHNVNLRGNQAGVNYNFNYGHLDDQGFTPGNDLLRDSFSLGGNANLNNGLRLATTLNYSHTRFKTPPVAAGYGSNVGGEGASVFANVFYTPRSVDLTGLPYQNPVTGESIYYRQNNSIQNPRWTVANASNSQDTRRTFGSFSLGFDVVKNLAFSYRYGIDIYSEKNVNYTNKGGKTGNVANRSGIYETWNNTNQIVDHNFSLTGNHALSEAVDLNYTVGWTARSDAYDRYGTRSVGQQVYGVLRHFNFANQDEIEFFRRRNIVGIYGQAELDYKDYLYLTLATRRDRVSNLSQENNSISYPSAAISFLPTTAFEGLYSNTINFLKLRVGYGTSANFPLGYPIASTLSLDVQDFQDRGGVNVITNTTAQLLGNPNLKPERIDETEFGIEGRFFNNRVSLDFSLYNRSTRDLIVERPLDPTTGYTMVQTNVGRISNNGVEIDLGVDWIKNKDWLLSTAFNWTTNEAIVEDLGQDTDQIVYTGFSNRGNVAIEGESLGAFVGTTIARNDNGDYLVNGAGSYVENNDPQIIGDANPDWILNIGNTLSYKNLDFTFLFNHTRGGDIFTYTVATLLGRGLTVDTLDRENTFILPGVSSGSGQANQVQINNSTYYFSNVLYGPDEMLVYDASVLRLAEISLGYSFPQRWLEKTPFSSVKLAAQGFNLWYDAYNIPDGTNFDPNIAGLGVGNGRGFDYINGPSSKRYGFSLNLSF